VTGTVIAVAALVLALVSFIAQQYRAGTTAKSSKVVELETRIDGLEDDLRNSRKEVELKAQRIVELENENFRLMRKLLANGTKP
jgi:hypothetical protein